MAERVNPTCAAFQSAIDLLGKPWTGMLLGVLQEGPLRFGEISTRMAGCGDRMLSLRLKELEDRGVVARSVDAGRPVRVSYSLTEKGVGFHQVAAAIQKWGHSLTEAPQPKARSIAGRRSRAGAATASAPARRRSR